MWIGIDEIEVLHINGSEQKKIVKYCTGDWSAMFCQKTGSAFSMSYLNQISISFAIARIIMMITEINAHIHLNMITRSTGNRQMHYSVYISGKIY